jgi:hypothetical protein
MADSVMLYHATHPAVEQDVAREDDGERAVVVEYIGVARRYAQR